jgi:hypothetical protein
MTVSPLRTRHRGRFVRSGLVAVVILLAVAFAVARAQPTPASTATTVAQKKGAPAALPAAPRLDLNNPDDALKAARKLDSSLEDGKPTTFAFQGNVLSRVPGEKDRLLFNFVAMNIRASKTLSEPGRGYGYRMVSRELLIYKDPKTKEVLRTWKNPWTGKEVEVVHVSNDPVNTRPMFAQGPDGPFRFNATIQDGLGVFQEDVPLFYTNPLGGDYQQYVGGDYQGIEMFMYFFNEKELLDASPDAPGVQVGWTRVSQFLPWMEMGGRVGYMIFSGACRKVSGFDALPDALKAEINARYPEYKVPPPLDDTRPNVTSWSYFKKWVDQKRAAAPQPPIK